MPTKKKTDAAMAAAREEHMPHRQSPSPMRHGDEKRGSASDRLDNFANNVRPAENNKPKIDRRRKRLTTADIDVPRKQLNLNAVRFGLRGLDILMVCAVIALGIWNGYIGTNNRGIAAPVAASLLGSVIFISALFASNAYRFNAAQSWSSHMKNVGLASFAALGIWLTIALITRPETFLPDALAKAGLGAIALILVLHSIYYVQMRKLHVRGALAPTIVMLGATDSARRIIEENAKTKELNILAIFDDRLARTPHNIYGVPVIGKVEDLEFKERVKLLPNRIAFVVDEFENLNHVKQRVSEIAEVSMRDVTGNPKSGRHTAVKRLSDIVISATALVLGSPFLLLIAALIRLDSKGPILFKQERHGFNNRVFHVYKFRSMRTEMSDFKAAKQTTKNDPRVTKIGRFIRKTSIDELPQLLNVLRGEMSLVGPRPHATGMETEGKSSIDLVAEYAHRHKVKPGMTGWAQINGSRGPLHNGAEVAERVRLDVEYIERSNVFFDIYIMLKTLPVLLGDTTNTR